MTIQVIHTEDLDHDSTYSESVIEMIAKFRGIIVKSNLETYGYHLPESAIAELESRYCTIRPIDLKKICREVFESDFHSNKPEHFNELEYLDQLEIGIESEYFEQELLTNRELADLPASGWLNSRIDTSKYYESISWARKVNFPMFEVCKNQGELCIVWRGSFYVA